MDQSWTNGKPSLHSPRWGRSIASGSCALVTAGPDGLAAGTLATEVGVANTNLSFHLKELSHAGLITSRREGKSVIYSAAFAGLSDLIAFLMRDCCQGRPEVCAPAVAALSACDCPTGDTAHA